MYIWKTNLELSSILINFSSINENNKLTTGQLEGFSRLAVHAGYYACLNKIREINELKEIKTVSGGNESHINIIDAILTYDDHSEVNKNKLVRRMRQLKEYRRKADYERGYNNIFKSNFICKKINEFNSVFEELEKF